MLASLRQLLRLRQELAPETWERRDAAGVHPLAGGARSRAADRRVSRTSSGPTFRRASSRRPYSSSPIAQVLPLVLTDEPIAGSEGAALRLRALTDYSHRTTEIALGPLSDAAAGELLTAILGATST